MNWPQTNEDIIRSFVLANEGGFTNNAADHGGATNWGITQETLSAWRGHPVTVDDVRNMPLSEATAIYAKRYISDPGFDRIADMGVRTALVDAGVLFGPQSVIKALQHILEVPEDGILGDRTIAKVATTEPRGLINALSVWRITKHALRVDMDPSQHVFLRGWVSRATLFII